ncbi:Protein of unknown function [Fontibacillus panacisegetis]|uniref:DUF3006 domain-containing protein n=1 Tax=Fontibacillus panacisegetis TaxID=670482 RepID=A0A1G7HUD4_9BACL|nr:DUF3006 domain-containing protein [Fontibacillus panacisegetis]SDF03923.1 Protein of unknown function [Fontibacillus panacisegetis]
MTGIIEEFEGNLCIIEVDGKTRDFSRDLVDSSAKAGDVVEWNGTKWVVNCERTVERTKEIKDLMDQLWED